MPEINYDIDIPNETIISFETNGSAKTMYYGLGSLIIVNIILLLLLNIYGVILSIVFLIVVYRKYKNTIKIEDQIILNNDGIQTINTNFFRWSQIKNEQVISEGPSSHKKYFLMYEHPLGIEKLRIELYAIDNKKLEELIKIYRNRTKLNNNR